MPWWSSFSATGVQGDATKATAEKGVALLEAAVEECVGFVRELLSWPLPERREPRETVCDAAADPADPRPRSAPGGGPAHR